MQSQISRVNYPALLDQAWKQHLARRKQNAPTLISLFAGCGGSSLGYSMAGYRELLAVEWDRDAVKTFKRNFPKVPVFSGDIKTLTIAEVVRRFSQVDIEDLTGHAQEL